ncbi:MAG TPA: luciferase family protein [Jatrophihabitantaceae bacterium]|nr:luciferase family protein [Jatrophihabitantaceae bacterium]
MGVSLWEAFVAGLLNHAPVVERRSRYADKPALFLERREIAHLEAPGVIDLRLTRQGWTQLRDRLGGDARVRYDARRRDWVELQLRTTQDVVDLDAVLAATAAHNS